MTTPEMVHHDLGALPLRRRLSALGCVAVARVLSTRPPQRIRTVLLRLSRNARPATQAEVSRALDAVSAVSLACRGPEGCVPRSLAAALLCRAWGAWPAWCVGVRRVPPFGAHAWLEADGVAVGEPYPPGYFRSLLVVAPRERASGA